MQPFCTTSQTMMPFTHFGVRPNTSRRLWPPQGDHTRPCLMCSTAPGWVTDFANSNKQSGFIRISEHESSRLSLQHVAINSDNNKNHTGTPPPRHIRSCDDAVLTSCRLLFLWSPSLTQPCLGCCVPCPISPPLVQVRRMHRCHHRPPFSGDPLVHRSRCTRHGSRTNLAPLWRQTVRRIHVEPGGHQGRHLCPRCCGGRLPHPW